VCDQETSIQRTGDENEGKKIKRQAKNQVDGSSKERYGKEREEMDAGDTRQGKGRQGQIKIYL
jgi:hypothetical protein